MPKQNKHHFLWPDSHFVSPEERELLNHTFVVVDVGQHNNVHNLMLPPEKPDEAEVSELLGILSLPDRYSELHPFHKIFQLRDYFKRMSSEPGIAAETLQRRRSIADHITDQLGFFAVSVVRYDQSIRSLQLPMRPVYPVDLAEIRNYT